MIWKHDPLANQTSGVLMQYDHKKNISLIVIITLTNLKLPSPTQKKIKK